ncbi:MAG: ion transporter [Pseudomonadota bacterium]
MPIQKTDPATRLGLRDRIRIVIFEAETPAGKTFDVALIVAILVSVLAVMLDTVPTVHARYGAVLYIVEWTFTVVFLIEYLVRLWCINEPLRYARSFFGLIDLLCLLPSFIGLLLPGSQNLLVIRILRVLRVFRVLRMVRYVDEAQFLLDALRNSRRKITVFISTVVALVVIFGSLMYLIEGEANGFTSIPKSVYWAVITLTTVGYGDLTPVTPLGQTVATLVMIMGYGIIAVPTGIITMEMTQAGQRRSNGRNNTRVCPHCSCEGHTLDARFCYRCGGSLNQESAPGEPGLAELPESLKSSDG